MSHISLSLTTKNRSMRLSKKFKFKKIFELQIVFLKNSLLSLAFSKRSNTLKENHMFFDKKKLLTRQSIKVIDPSVQKNHALSFEQMIEALNLLKKNKKISIPILKKCFNNAFFNNSKKVNKHSNELISTEFFDLSILLNAINFMVFFLVEKNLKTSHKEASDENALQHREPASEDVTIVLNEIMNECDHFSEKKFDEVNLDLSVYKKIIDVLQLIFSDEKNLEIGLQLFQFFSIFFISKKVKILKVLSLRTNR